MSNHHDPSRPGQRPDCCEVDLRPFARLGLGRDAIIVENLEVTARERPTTRRCLISLNEEQRGVDTEITVADHGTPNSHVAGNLSRRARDWLNFDDLDELHLRWQIGNKGATVQGKEGNISWPARRSTPSSSRTFRCELKAVCVMANSRPTLRGRSWPRRPSRPRHNRHERRPQRQADLLLRAANQQHEARSPPIRVKW